MNTYLVSISYDGSKFSGWAKQPNLITIQGFIESRLTHVFKEEIKILASSRTDKGVHALDQKFTFKTNINFDKNKLRKILEKSLGEFIGIEDVKKINSLFHPINDVLLKEYRYYIKIGDNNVFLKNYCWQYPFSLDVFKLRNILKIFEGYHDFFNFSYCRRKDRNIKDTYRRINKITVSKNNDLITIKFLAKGFLRYQIRAIVGESVHYCLNNSAKDNSELESRIKGRVDSKYKRIAPPSGLYLWRIKTLRI
jgi:tRNA pseudouridine38-40 synthase